MKLSLVVQSEGKAFGAVIPITLSTFVIGRDPQCQLRPASAVISKRHCAVITRGAKFYIRDFDSTNGTFLNDEPVKGECELKADDTLMVGPLTFKVTIEGVAPAPVPVNKPTPIPKAPPKDSGDDDSVAAMLLALADEEGGGSTQPRDADGVPGGTTIMEMMSPTDATPVPQEAEAKPAEAGKTAAAKAADKKKNEGNTSEAAQAILQKYMRRQRT